jgi:protein-S-isoprenylcysteine O-methyltransferase Ste14
MRKQDAVAVLGIAAGMVTVGVTWLFGPWGLVGAGVVLAVVALIMPVKE